MPGWMDVPAAEIVRDNREPVMGVRPGTGTEAIGETGRYGRWLLRREIPQRLIPKLIPQKLIPQRPTGAISVSPYTVAVCGRCANEEEGYGITGPRPGCKRNESGRCR